MLVLSRKSGERIHIGNDITVTVVEITGRLVRLGVEAPGHVNIMRAELIEQVERENISAAEKIGYLDRLKDLRSLLRTKKKERS